MHKCTKDVKYVHCSLIYSNNNSKKTKQTNKKKLKTIQMTMNQVNKLQCFHTMECYPRLEKDKISLWVVITNITLSKRNQTHKTHAVCIQL